MPTDATDKLPESEPSAETQPKKKHRIAYVDGLRALAALSVVIYHIKHFFFERPIDPAGSAILKTMSYGNVGVPIFLVLSGFCLGLPAFRRGQLNINVKTFFLRRCWRILPPYYLVMIPLALVTLTPLYAMRGKEATDAVDFFTHLVLIHNLSDAHIQRISGQLWSIGLEFQLYILFPLLMLGFRKPLVIFGAGLAAAGAWWAWGAASGLDHSFAFMASPVSYLPLFVGGMFAARIASHDEWHSNPAWIWPALAAFALSFFFHWREYTPDTAKMMVAGLGTCLILAMTLPAWLREALSWRPLVYIGERSYTLYLIHSAIVAGIAAIAMRHLHGPAYLAAAVISGLVCVALAPPIYRFIELPFVRKSQSIGRSP